MTADEARAFDAWHAWRIDRHDIAPPLYATPWQSLPERFRRRVTASVREGRAGPCPGGCGRTTPFGWSCSFRRQDGTDVYFCGRTACYESLGGS